MGANELVQYKMLIIFALKKNISIFSTISAHEMKEFFADHMPEHVNGVHMMIAAFDDNGDGKINMDEAMKMAQAKGEGMKTIMANYMFKNTGDQNGDGFVSKHEYHTAMMCLGMGPDLTERYMNEDFAKYDADGDEQMNFEEFKAHLIEPKDDEKKINWFRAIDKDGNGEITIAEQIMTWESMGAHEMANIDMIHPMTLKWDMDKDGKLNMDEFKQQP